MYKQFCFPFFIFFPKLTETPLIPNITAHLLDCWKEPAPSLGNMSRSWDGSFALNTKAFYR